MLAHLHAALLGFASTELHVPNKLPVLQELVSENGALEVEWDPVPSSCAAALHVWD